jgi:hypothetical protein
MTLYLFISILLTIFEDTSSQNSVLLQRPQRRFCEFQAYVTDVNAADLVQFVGGEADASVRCASNANFINTVYPQCSADFYRFSCIFNGTFWLKYCNVLVENECFKP